MASVFISYRREDSAGFARAVYDRLCDEFGPDQVFMDVEAIEPGTDFVDSIDVAVSRCDALIAIIGRQWSSIANDSGRRLDDPEDYVRIEIAAALRRDIRVIPVLVQDADMPPARDLPDDLSALARRNAVKLSTTNFSADMDRLIDTLKKIVKAAMPAPREADIARTDYIRFLEKAITSQRMAQRFHLLLAIVVVSLGLIAIGAAHMLSGELFPADQKWLVTLGGSFTSTLSTFPIKQIFERRTRLSALEFLLDGFTRLRDQTGSLSGQDAARLSERFWKLMDASLGTQPA